MIRPITMSDIDRVVVLAQQLWPNKKIATSEIGLAVNEYIEDPSYMIFGYEDKGLLIGFITVSIRYALFYEGKVATIEDLIVDQEHRGGGIGYGLVRYVEQLITKDSDVNGIELSSDLHREETFKFWEKCGFQRCAYQFRKTLKR